MPAAALPQRRRPGLGGLDGPEAIGAVDRLVHAGLERNLGRVPALGADHREILARGPVVATFVAAGTADVAHVITAGVSRSPPRRAAAGTSLGVRSEPFLRVELLVR